MSDWSGNIIRGTKSLGNDAVHLTKSLGSTLNLSRCIPTLSGWKDNVVDGTKSLGNGVVNVTKDISIKAKNLGIITKEVLQSITEADDTVKIMIISGKGLIGTSLLLKGIGFTVSGVKLGSIAAGIQSSIGNVSAGSIFSHLQWFSAIDGGTTLVIVGGALVVGGVTYYGVKKYQEHQSDKILMKECHMSTDQWKEHLELSALWKPQFKPSL